MCGVRRKARLSLQEFCDLRVRDFKSEDGFTKAQTDILNRCFGNYGKSSYIEQPIFFDYGFNVYIGNDFYSNINLTLLDTAIIKIGDRVLCGPNVSLITATHSSDPNIRGTLLENGWPITIGDNVWLCANATVLPGVKIGSGSVIGAGCVVNKSVPPNSVVVGVPGKIIKQMEGEEKDSHVKEILKKRGIF